MTNLDYIKKMYEEAGIEYEEISYASNLKEDNPYETLQPPTYGLKEGEITLWVVESKVKAHRGYGLFVNALYFSEETGKLVATGAWE